MRRAHDVVRTPNDDLGPHKSNRVRNPVQWFTYDRYVSHHYLCMAKVKQDVEPMSYENVVGNVH